MHYSSFAFKLFNLTIRRRQIEEEVCSNKNNTTATSYYHQFVCQ